MITYDRRLMILEDQIK
jgi:hypothetical protein